MEPARLTASRPTAAARLAWLLALAALAACQPIERVTTDRAAPIATVTCEAGPVQLVTFDPAGRPLVACPDKNLSLGTDDATWTALPGLPAITAWLPPAEGRDAPLVATVDGKLAWLPPDGPRVIDLPAQPDQGEGTLYGWRPRGLEGVGDAVVVGLFEGYDNKLIAVSAGAGAWISRDGGDSWQVLPWLQRLRQLDGDRPLAIHDLLISDEDQIALLHYPNGVEAAYAPERLHAIVTDPTLGRPLNTRHGGGPHVANGVLTRQHLKSRYLPVGRGHALLRGPGNNGTRLWIMVTHPERHEMTRYISRDWGETYIDVGYYNFTPLAIDDAVARVAIVGRTDRDETILWLSTEGHLNRYAFIDLPEGQGASEGPPLLSLPLEPYPERLLLARGATATFYDISDVGADVRLLWYYLPIGLLLLIGGALAVRRALTERQLKAERARQLAEHRAAWQAKQSAANDSDG